MKYRIVLKDNQELVKVYNRVVHRFRLGDVEDPDTYQDIQMVTWRYSPPGEFVSKHALENSLEIHRQLDQHTHCWRVCVTADLEEQKLSEFYFKYGIPND